MHEGLRVPTSGSFLGDGMAAGGLVAGDGQWAFGGHSCAAGCQRQPVAGECYAPVGRRAADGQPRMGGGSVVCSSSDDLLSCHN